MYESCRNPVTILIAIAACGASLATAQDDEQHSGLMNEIETKEIDSGDAVEIWQRYGRSNSHVKAVKEILFDPDQEKGNRIEAAMLIGIHGGMAAREALLEYIRNPLPEVLTHEEAEVFCWAISSLGWIKDETVLNELKAMAGRKYWEARKTQPEIKADKYQKGKNAYRTQSRFRECALIGITRMNRKDTFDIMQALVDSDAISDFHPEAIKSYLQEAQAVSDGERGPRRSSAVH